MNPRKTTTIKLSVNKNSLFTAYTNFLKGTYFRPNYSTFAKNFFKSFVLILKRRTSLNRPCLFPCSSTTDKIHDNNILLGMIKTPYFLNKITWVFRTPDPKVLTSLLLNELSKYRIRSRPSIIHYILNWIYSTLVDLCRIKKIGRWLLPSVTLEMSGSRLYTGEVH